MRELALHQTQRLLDPDLAEDAAQEAVLRAWRHARTCAGADPRPWVVTIARREAVRLATRRREEPVPNEPGGARSTDYLEADRVVDRLEIQAVVGELSLAEQKALLLHYWADMSHQQIAAVLNTPLGTAKLRIFRARKKLTARLGPRALSNALPPTPRRRTGRSGIR